MPKKGDAELKVKLKTEGQQELTNVQKVIENLGKAVDDLNKKSTGGIAQRMGDTFNKIESGGKAVVSGMAGAVAAIGTFGAAIVALGVKAGKFDQIREAFSNLTASQGQDSKQILAQMKEMTDGMVSNVDLMVNANRAIMLGLPVERFPEMLKIAKSASEATGESMEFMLQSITLALGRQSKLILDNLGIIVDVEGAYKKFAAQIGKTADQLTETEKKQAFMNEALRIGAENAEASGGSADNANKKWQRFKAGIEDSTVTLGQGLTPAVNLTLDALNALLRATKSFGESQALNLSVARTTEFLLEYRAALETLVLRAAQVKDYFMSWSLFGNTKADIDKANNLWEGWNNTIRKNSEENDKEITKIREEAERRRVEIAIDSGKKIEAADRALAVKIKAERIKQRKEQDEKILKGEKIRLEKERLANEESEKQKSDAAIREKVDLDNEKLDNDRWYVGEKQKLTDQYSGRELEIEIAKLEEQKILNQKYDTETAIERLENRGKLTKEELKLYEDLKKEQVKLEGDATDKRIKIEKQMEKQFDEEGKAYSKLLKDRQKENEEYFKKAGEMANTMLTSGFQGVASAGVGALTESFLPGFGAAASSAFNLLSQDTEEFLNTVNTLFSTDFINNISNNLPIMIERFHEALPGLITAITDKMPEITEKLIQSLIEHTPEIAIALGKVFTNPEFWNRMVNAFANGFYNGIKSGFDAAWQYIKNRLKIKVEVDMPGSKGSGVKMPSTGNKNADTAIDVATTVATGGASQVFDGEDDDGNPITPWANGGPVYANMGKLIPFMPKGTDTVPAMLTPGEFVVNRAATQKNMGLLQHINSGGSPGSTVINITVNGGFLGDAQSARELARAIDKEVLRLRRDNESIGFDSVI